MAIRFNNISESWLHQLKTSGYKITGPRYCVIEILAHTERALTVTEIYNQAHMIYPTIGLVSIYRALEKLESLALIQRVHQKEKCQAFIAASNGHEHLLLCHSCGRVIYFQGDNLNELVKIVEQDSGYLVQEHWLQLVGICKECQQENQ